MHAASHASFARAVPRLAPRRGMKRWQGRRQQTLPPPYRQEPAESEILQFVQGSTYSRRHSGALGRAVGCGTASKEMEVRRGMTRPPDLATPSSQQGLTPEARMVFI